MAFFQFGFGSLSEIASYDGTGNNVDHPEWGSAMEQYLRLAPVGYADGLSEPARVGLANARDISEWISVQDESIENDRFLTSVWFQWGTVSRSRHCAFVHPRSLGPDRVLRHQ